MDGRIMSDEWQAIGQFKSATVVQRAFATNATGADGSLMNQLHGQTWRDRFARLACPATQQVPRSQSQMFGDQQPDASKVAADFVGQALPDSTLDALRITRLGLAAFATDTGLDLFAFRARTALIEFFFEGRIRRSHVGHCDC